MATYFWVGGTGTWDSLTTTNWSSSSGGSGSAGVPGTADTAAFDSNSGNGTVSLTTSANIAQCLSMTFDGSTAGSSGTYTGTFNFNGAQVKVGGISSSGIVSFTAGMTLTVPTSSLINFVAGNTNLTTTGQSMPGIYVNTSGGTITLEDTCTCGVSFLVTLNQGTLNTNNQTCSWGSFISNNSNARTLTMGSSNIAITGNVSGSAWYVGTSNLTITANTATAAFSTANDTIQMGSFNYNGLSIVINSQYSINFGATGSISSLTYAPTPAIPGNSLSISGNFTVTGNITFTGSAAPNRIIVLSSTIGTARTITCNGTVTASYCDFQDITAAGTATWNLSAITGGSGDCQGNSGITLTTPQTNYWVGGTANFSSATAWASSSGGTAGSGRVTLPQDTAQFDVNSFTSTGKIVTFDTPRYGSVSFTGSTNSPTVAWSTPTSCYGNWTATSIVAASGSGANTFTFRGRSTQTITNGGLMYFPNLVFLAPGGTYTLQDSLVSSNTNNANIIFTEGTFNAVTFNVSRTTAGIGSGNTCGVSMGTGTWTLSSSGTTWLTNSTGLTFSAGTSTLVMTNTSGIATITTAGTTMPSLTISGVGGTTQFNDTFTTAGAVILTAGALNTNGQTCTFLSFTSTTTSVRTLTLGSSSITFTASSTTACIISPTNLTFTANTATFIGASTATAQNWYFYGTNCNGLSIILNNINNCNFGDGAATFANFTYAPANGVTNVLTISSGFTVTGTVTFTGAAPPNRILVQSSVPGTQEQLTCNGTIIASYVDFTDFIGSGSASWNLASITGGSGNCQNCIGLTFTTAQTNYYYTTANANWSTVSNWYLATDGTGGAGRVPLPQDTAIFDLNSGAHVCTMDTERFGNWTCTGATTTFTQTTASGYCYGNLIGPSTLTSPNLVMYLCGRGSQTVSGFSSINPGYRLWINAPGGSYTQQNNMLCALFVFQAGTYNANGYNINATVFEALYIQTTAPVVVNMGSGTWTVSNGNASGLAWNFGTTTGLTVNCGTSTLNWQPTIAGALTFAGGGYTYYNFIWATAYNVSQTLIITGSNSFSSFGCQAVSTGRNLEFTHATTQTIAPGGWSVSGVNNGYQYLPGISGDYISTPSSTALDITGDIDIRWYGSLSSWTPTSQAHLMGKWQTSGQYSYLLSINTAGGIELSITTDGSTTQNASSSSPTGASASTLQWIRATRQQSGGTVTFYTGGTAATPTWTQLGTSQTLAAGTAMFNSTSIVEIGSDNGGGNSWAQSIYRTQIYNGIAGTLVLDANFAAKTLGQNSFTESSSNAATMTINGVGAQQGDGRVLINSDLAGTAAILNLSGGKATSNYLSIQDSNPIQANTWYAVNSKGVSNTGNWIFGAAPNGGFLMGMMGVG